MAKNVYEVKIFILERIRYYKSIIEILDDLLERNASYTEIFINLEMKNKYKSILKELEAIYNEAFQF